MNIVLGVTGSISAYKSYEICRGLIKEGHRVVVITTQGALNFVHREVYEYLGADHSFGPKDDFHPDRFPHSRSSPVLHIELANWADRLIIAPLSANTLSALSRGEAFDLLTSVYLSLHVSRPVALFPAMNTQMLQHPITAKNIANLNLRPHQHLYPPNHGPLACGETGAGKLPEVSSIVACGPLYPPIRSSKGPKRSILITTGATVAPLDPVRYLTNPSSGTTGRLLAKKFLQQGYHVDMVCGGDTTSQQEFQDLAPIPNLTLHPALTTEKALQVILQLFPQCQLYISAAAFCDLTFSTAQTKLKKDALPSSIAITKAPDILQEVLKLQQPHQKVVGFAAESPLSPKILLQKMKKKPVDLLVGNSVHRPTEGRPMQGFGGNQPNHYLLMTSNYKCQTQEMDKGQLAQKIFQWWENNE